MPLAIMSRDKNELKLGWGDQEVVFKRDRLDLSFRDAIRVARDNGLDVSMSSSVHDIVYGEGSEYAWVEENGEERLVLLGKESESRVERPEIYWPEILAATVDNQKIVHDYYLARKRYDDAKDRWNLFYEDASSNGLLTGKNEAIRNAEARELAPEIYEEMILAKDRCEQLKVHHASSEAVMRRIEITLAVLKYI